MSGVESDSWDAGSTAVGPSFWPPYAPMEPVSTRWLGLRLVWRSSRSLRALLALSIILLVLCNVFGWLRGAGGPAEGFAVLLALVCGFVFVGTASYLTGMLLLGVLQWLTGRSPGELEMVYTRLPAWTRIPVVLMLALSLVLATIVIVLICLYLAFRIAGLA